MRLFNLASPASKFTLVALLTASHGVFAQGSVPLFGNIGERLRAAAKEVGSQVTGSGAGAVAAQMKTDADNKYSVSALESNLKRTLTEARNSPDYLKSEVRGVARLAAQIQSEALGKEINEILSEFLNGDAAAAKQRLLGLAESKLDFSAAALVSTILYGNEYAGKMPGWSDNLRSLKDLAEQKNPIAMFVYGRWLILARQDRAGVKYLEDAWEAGHWAAGLAMAHFQIYGTGPFRADPKAGFEMAAEVRQKFAGDAAKAEIDKFVADRQKDLEVTAQATQDRERKTRERVQQALASSGPKRVIFFCNDKYRNGAAFSLAKGALNLAASSDQAFAHNFVRPPMSDYCQMAKADTVLKPDAIALENVELVADRPDGFYFIVKGGTTAFGVQASK